MFFSMRSFVFLQYFFINWSSTCQLSYEGSMLSISGIMPLTSPCWTTWHSLSNSFYQRILFLSYFALTCFNLDIFPYCLTAIHTFFSEAVVIPEICLWLSFPCHVWSHPTFPASCFYPPPQSPALLALLSSCPVSPGVAASASEGQPSLFLEDKAYLLSSQTVGLGDQGLVQPQGIQAVHCFTARTSGEAERRHSMCEFASTTLESTSPDSQDPAYSENDFYLLYWSTEESRGKSYTHPPSQCEKGERTHRLDSPTIGNQILVKEGRVYFLFLSLRWFHFPSVWPYTLG